MIYTNMKGAMQYSTEGVNNDYVLFTTTYYLQLPTKSTTYNYLSTVTLHNLFTLYTFDNIGAGFCMVRIGKGGYLNVPYDILLPIWCQTGWGIPYVLIYTQKNNWRILKFFWHYNIWEYNFQTNYFCHW